MLTFLFQDNILLDSNFHVQIADFGLTRLEEATKTRPGGGGFTLNFAAPELLLGGLPEDDNKYPADAPGKTPMSDVYAFGCLYYEVGDDKRANAMLLLNYLDSF